ncbi:MAG TPA: ABC transporter permease [Solirubrobacteraceae bacterium]|jgi:putative spermidine/putrescine transport system permease protein|nr:ABC transporter permease [Solirubrobacteraceae bacterium]
MRLAGRSAETSLPASPPREAGSDDAEGHWSAILANRWALLLVAPLLAVLLGFVAYPLAKLTIDSLSTGDGIGNYEAVLQSSAGRRALITTVLASVLVGAVAVLLGGLLAWHIRIAKSAVVKAVLWLAVLAPFWMGTVVKNYAIVILLSAEGPLDKGLELVGLAPVSLLYTSTAVGIGMVYTMVPYAAFALYGVFLTIDESLLLAARGMGASRARAIVSVLLPLAMPGILASGALVFAISLGFYVTPVLLGGAQTPFMASFIQDYIFTFYDYPIASAASVILLAVALLTLGLTLALVGRGRLRRAVA